MFQNYHTKLLTGTVFNWNHLLKDDIYKWVMIDSFQWLIKEKRCIINAFVIMPDHFHLTCLPAGGFGKYQMDWKEKMCKAPYSVSLLNSKKN